MLLRIGALAVGLVLSLVTSANTLAPTPNRQDKNISGARGPWEIWDTNDPRWVLAIPNIPAVKHDKRAAAVARGTVGHTQTRPVKDPLSAATASFACCDHASSVVRPSGDRKIVLNTLPGQTVADDARTREEALQVDLSDIANGAPLTMAPRVGKDRVLVGVGFKYSIW